MSRYLIQRLTPEEEAPPDEHRVRFTLDLRALDEIHLLLTFAQDWIQQRPDPPSNTLSSFLKLINNFLPPPKP